MDSSSSIHSKSSAISQDRSSYSPSRGPRQLPSADPNRPFPFTAAQQQARAKQLAIQREAQRKEEAKKKRLQAKVGPIEAFARHYQNQRQLPTKGHVRAQSELNDGSSSSNNGDHYKPPSSLDDLALNLHRTRLDASNHRASDVPTLLLPGRRRGSNSTLETNTASPVSHPSSSSTSSATSTASSDGTWNSNPHLRINPPAYLHSNSSSSSVSSATSTTSSTSSSPKFKPLPSLPLARTVSQLKHQTQNQFPYSSPEYLSKIAHSNGVENDPFTGSNALRFESQLTSVPGSRNNSEDTHQISIPISNPSSNHSRIDSNSSNSTSRPLPIQPQKPAFGLPRPPILIPDQVGNDHSRLQEEQSRASDRLGPIQSHASAYLGQNAPDLGLQDGFRQVSTPLPHMPEPAVAPNSTFSSDRNSNSKIPSTFGPSRMEMPVPVVEARSRNLQPHSMQIHRPIPVSRPHSFDPSSKGGSTSHSHSAPRPNPISQSHSASDFNKNSQKANGTLQSLGGSTPTSFIDTPSCYSSDSPSFPESDHPSSAFGIGGSTPLSFLDTPSCYSSDTPLLSEGRGSSHFGNSSVAPPCLNPWLEDQVSKKPTLTQREISEPSDSSIKFQSTPNKTFKAPNALSLSSESSASSPALKVSTPQVKPSSIIQSDPALPPARYQCWGIKKDGKRCTRKVGNDASSRSSPAPKGKTAGKGKKRPENSTSGVLKSKSNSNNLTIDLVSDSDDSDVDGDGSISFQSNSTARSRSKSPRKPISRDASPIKVTTMDDSDSDSENSVMEEDYCHQHAKEINLATGFYLVSGEKCTRTWIEFSTYIPTSTPLNLAARIRTNMTSPLSLSDLSSLNKGYIYIYELRDRRTISEKGESLLCLKIGRAKNVFKRMSEWRSQCQSKEPVLRYFSPETKEERSGEKEQILMSGLGRTERMGIKGSHRWERLIHLELNQFKIKEKCSDCGSVHQEIFLVPDDDGKGFERCRDIVRKWEEWERLVVGEEESDDEEVQLVGATNGLKGRNGRNWDLS